MTILVTGAPGWLGTEVVRELDAAGFDDVRCLVLEGVDTTELDPFDVTLYPGDVTDRDTLYDAYEGGVDTVFHCAGIIHPPKLTGASMFYEINTRGTENMLDAAREHGCDHFVYISSNAAQGFNDTRDEWMTEDMPCEPESNYGKSKYQAEQHVRRYHDEYGLEYTIVRPCWYYGPRQPDRMATLMQMIKGGTPIVFGDGENLRSMTYIPKLVDALLKIMDRPGVSKQETYWIADETPYTTNHIYETIAECLGVADSYDPRHIPWFVSRALEIADVTLGKLGLYEKNIHVGGEMRRNIACDPSKAMAELDYDPPSELEPGMQEAVDWAIENGQV